VSRADFLGSLITQAGYQTCLVGKSHWHTDPSFRAGFETFVDLEQWRELVHARAGRAFSAEGLGSNEMFSDRSQLPPELFETNWTVDECIRFLQYRDRTQQFFLWASFQDPHPPNVIHEPYFSMYDGDNIPEPVIPQWVGTDEEPYTLLRHRSTAWNSVRMTAKQLEKARVVYYGKITNLDHQLGRLLGKLTLEGLTQDTLIIYTSDHGRCGHRGARGHYREKPPAHCERIVIPCKGRLPRPNRAISYVS
jgi:arylsulfatase